MTLTVEEKRQVEVIREEIKQQNALGYLSVENFGPIKKAELNVKKLTLFIGKNNTGKSTIAKLITIFSDLLVYSLNKEDFGKALKRYDIFSFLSSDTKILWIGLAINGVYRYSNESVFSDYVWDDVNPEKIPFFRKVLELEQYSEEHFSLYADILVKNSPELKDSIPKVKEIINKTPRRQKIAYIPAERELITTLSNSTFFLLAHELPISESIILFGSLFQKARSNIEEIDMEFLGIKYQREKDKDLVFLSEKESLDLDLASSGVKATIPAFIVLAEFENKDNSFVTFEEPENNLYPAAQKGFVNILSRFCLQGSLQFLTVTTHSPYILASFNNLIQAGTLAKEKPELEDDIAKIIPRESWIEFDDVNAYSLENGTVKSIIDDEWNGIVAEEIDSASNQIGEEYDRILELKYRE